MQYIIPIQRLPHGEDIPLPAYATPGSVGMDLCATEAYTLVPGERKLIPTGFAVALPNGYEGQIRPRSGLALNYGVTVLNAPGTIDADYRGELKVLLVNFGQEPFSIQRGQRIAQFVIAPIVRANWTLVADLPSTERQDKGFGSTGSFAA